MRFSLFILLTIITFSSCSKKKEVIKTGTFKDMNGVLLAYEMYSERDTFFRSISDPRNGMLYSIQRASTQKEIEDSSFSETVYSGSGKIVQTKSFLNKRPAGIWNVWNEKGVQTSYTKIENGNAIEYKAWFDDGRMRIEGKKNSDDTLLRREYFSNGKPDREFWIDSLGNGRCNLYFPNGKMREKGPLWQYAPSGIWNRFDSLGNTRSDTVYGMKPIE